MINRTLVRTRVLQTLFAYYEDGDKTPAQARKDLLKSFSDTYNLYAMLLSLADELSTYAQNYIAEQGERARFTHTKYTPNRRFADNTLAQQIFTNKTLRHLLSASHLTWEPAMDVMATLYKQLQECDYYKQFMALDAPTYEDERILWRKIYSDLLPDNETLLTALEELELNLDQQNWQVDLNVVLSYVVKTIKRFQQEQEADQPLLEMFDTEDELQFAQQLLELALAHKDEFDDLIKHHLKNWEIDRVAVMDRVILQLALTELCEFPDIAAQVTLNEYIELTKEYSSDKSYIFVNGILDEIIRTQKLFKIQ